jgi:23S rRNA (guanosine2251-2'-O)-methyltransferase
MNLNEILIYGKHPFFSVLKNNKRKIFSIYIANNNKNEFNTIILKEKISLKNLNIKFLKTTDIDKIFTHNNTYKDKNHQGYIMFVAEKNKKSLDDFLIEIKKKNELPKLLLLDQILDPHNLGALIRTAVAFGVYNIIITEFNSAKETATVSKSSAGLNELVDLISVTNLNNTIKDLKNVGYFIIGADGDSKMNFDQIKDTKNIALVLGNEGKGIRELVKKNCDDLVKIPMNEIVESLNVSVAGGILIYSLFGK